MIMTDYNDVNQLISNCVAGDQLATEMLIRRHQDGVYRLALSILDDPTEAYDAAQDSFIAAISALDSFQGDSSFKTWLYTIVLNISRVRLRKRKTIERLRNTLQAIFRVQTQRTASPEDFAIQNEKETLIWKALEKLNDKHRIPIILRYYHEFSNAEIAKMLDINEGTVQSRLHVAREQLRTELKNNPIFWEAS
jgi:RNA polymerase sigma-70 factor (ECF subfamily)